MSRATLKLLAIIVAFGAHTAAADEQKDWSGAVKRNSPVAYQEYLRKNPSGAHQLDAKRRVNDQEYRFWTTCAIGTPEAIDGFFAFENDSARNDLLKQFRDYLTAISTDQSLKSFLAESNPNPFALIARARVPVNYLSAVNAIVEIKVSIGSVVFKGLISNSNSADGIANRLFTQYRDDLGQVGILWACLRTVWRP